MTENRVKFFTVFCLGFLVFAISFFFGNVKVVEGKKANELVVQTWGGIAHEAEEKAFFRPFEEKTGIKVVPVVVGAGLFGKIGAQVRSNNVEWDIITAMDYPSIATAANKGLMEAIDYDIVTNTADLIPGSTKKYGVANSVEVQVITYNHEKFSKEKYPKNWKEFFDVESFPGPRTMPNWGIPDQVLVAALLADGVAPDELVPIDYDRAFKKLDAIKPYVKVWYTGGDQSIQTMLREEAVIGMLTDGRAKGAIEMGAPINIVWEKGLFYHAYLAVVKGAPHRKAAMEFINFCCQPKPQSIYTKIVKYSGSNPKLLKFLDRGEQKNQAIHPDNFDKLIQYPSDENAEWVTAHKDEINEKWNTWLSQ
jgi:spermidine/putrescine-binding protein